MLYLVDEIIGKKLSRIGLGTARMGSRYDEKLSFEFLNLYENYGGNFLDTARNYYEWVEEGRGKSEKTIGKWMTERGNRDKMCILTKGGTHGIGSKKIDLSEKALTTDVCESLDALQTDYIDIYALHRDDPERGIAEIMYTLQKIIEIGKIRKICADCWDIDRIIQANQYAYQHQLTPFSSIETWWSLAEYTNEMWNDPATTNMTEKTLDYIDKKDILAIGVTTQCRGFFQKSIKYGIENISNELKARIATKRNIKKMEFIKDFCHKNNVSVSSFVNSYVCSSKYRSVGLISCSNTEQLKEVMVGSNYEMPREIRKAIDEI